MKEYWKQINRICKPDAPMFFFCNIKFGNSLINSNPKNYRYELLWIKRQATGFLNAKKMPMKKVEYIYVFYNKLSKVYTENIAKYHKHKFVKENDINKPKVDVKGKPNGVYGSIIGTEYRPSNRKKGEDSIYDPKLPDNVIKENTIYNKHTRNRDNELTYEPKLPDNFIKEEYVGGNVYGNIRERKYYQNGKRLGDDEPIYEPRLPDNILEYNSTRGLHPTQKPVELIKWILKYYTRPNDTCLDTTMGSGSTGVACKEMDINFIGMELDKEYFDVAKNRINNIVINK